MSTVYLAEDLGPLEGRRVALKVLSPTLSGDGDFRSRFRKEATTVANLEHPHIIPVYASGEEGPYLFLAMRYVEGSDLGRLLARAGQLSVVQVARIVSQLAGALDKAHRQYFVHRDVKPGNVLVGAPGTRDEHIYLTDFGIVKEVTAETGLTAAGQFFGTTDYAAPEQIENRRIDGRTDVYALAALIYHCLASEVPYPRSTDIEKLWAHLRDSPPSVTTLRPDVSSAVSDVITRGMAKRPEDRFENCVDLADTLQAAIVTQAETIRGKTQEFEQLVDPTLPIFRPPRRRRLAPVLVAALALLVLGAVAYQFSGRPPGDTLAPTPNATRSPSPTPSASPQQTFGPLEVRPRVLSRHEFAEPIADVLGLYFSAINAGDFRTAYSYETSQRKNAEWNLSIDAFEDYYRGSNMSDVTLTSVAAVDDRAANAQVTMKYQRVSQELQEDGECSLRRLNLRMKLGARWRIDDISEAEQPHPCA